MKYQIAAIDYHEELHGHPCIACELRCGCAEGGHGKECSGCPYCDPDKAPFRTAMLEITDANLTNVEAGCCKT